MKLLVFSIFDAKAEAYLQPFFNLTQGAAVREFADAVNTEGQPFNKHPEDYTLFLVGEFSQIDGDLHPNMPKALGNAVQYKITATPQLHGEQLELEG